MSRTRRNLYRAARIMGDVEAARSPRAARRRVKNRLVGRALRPVFRKLWS